MKKLTTLLLATLFSFALSAQNDPRIALSKTPLADVPLVLMPHLDNAALLAAEMERRGPGIPQKFAEPMEVDISPATHGQWEQLPNGNALWRLRIRSEGARSLNLGFTKYFMPTRGSLILYSPDYQTILGPFTPADNEDHQQLWTPILPGEELVVEVQVPSFQQSALQLELKYVNHDFVGFAEVASGSCNLDVICGAADNWAIVDRYRDIIQSVAVMQYQGSLNCTGFLVSNTRQDCAPLFMTANHCGVTAGVAPTLVNYWNFQNSTCRQPNSPASGGNGNGQLNDFNTGSILRASYAPSDFTLLELDDPVSPTANAFFAGWSAEDFTPTDTVIVVHHPSTDEKRISFEFDPTYVGSWGTGANPVPNGDHVVVPDYEIGTTEPGSSGAPLFNREKRVVGQLHGGGALCGNNDYDSYGWFYTSWTGGGTPNSRLKDWLDPDTTGITVLDGRFDSQCGYFVEGSPDSISLCAPSDAVYAVKVSPNFIADVTLSVANLSAGVIATFGTNPVAPGGTTTLTLSNTAALTEGTYGIQIEGTDGTAFNSANLQFFVAAQPPAPPALTAPADGTGGIGLTPMYQWAASPNTVYTIEIATDTAFSNIIETATNINAGAYTTTVPLVPMSTYFWRVRGENICGLGEWPVMPNTFATGAISCAPVASTNVPVSISDAGGISVTSTLTINNSGFVDDINVTNLNIQHSWVGDLRVELTSPSGTIITLFANPDGGNCSGDDINISLDDEAAATNDELLSTCGASPAIAGAFQPAQPLSTFNGEPITGNWTLTVYDDAQQDGGTLIGWGLDLCSTIPNDMSVTPSGNVQTNCEGAATNFTVLLGTAFDGTSGVTLTATGLPQDAIITFTPNPAQPGAQVAVNLSGVNIAGAYNFDIVATDALSGTGTATIYWNVLGGPDSPTTIAPAPNASGVSLSPVFSWKNVGATYQLAIATDPNMTNLVFQGTSTQPSLAASGLLPCTVYYWTVTASNQCGSLQPTIPQSFTTFNDLTFNVQQNSVASCPTGNANVSLAVGLCFESGGLTLSATGLPAGASMSFIQNPVPPGSSNSLSVSLINVASGSYVITLTGSDGVHNVTETFTLVVNALAAAPALVAPANAATNVNVKPNLDWNTVAGATSYFIQVATDADFNNIVFFNSTSLSAYTLTTPLNVNTTYYWRVFAFNSCGQGVEPVAFSFTTWLVNAVHELNGLTVSVLPNPTSGQVSAIFSKTTDENMDATLHSVNGILVKQLPIAIGSQSVSFDLSALPSGVYLLRLRSASGVLTKKIIKE